MNSPPILRGKHAGVFGAGGSVGAAVAMEFAAQGMEKPADFNRVLEDFLQL